MSQQQLGAGGLAALACYTVDSDFSSDEEEEKEDDEDKSCKDFGDVYIKQEPVEVVEEWSIDRQGVRDPTETVQEFMQLQEVKVEIESEAESDSDTSSSSDSDEELDNRAVASKDDEEKDEGPPRTKNELCPKDLPPVDDLTMSVAEADCLEVGMISSTVDELVVIESNPGVPALDLETILFLEKGVKALGKVFDVIGPVTRPYYVVRFNNDQHIQEKGVTKGLMVYYAPRTEHTTFVFLEQLMKMKISDASWMNDEEPPPQFIEYSDDEEERRVKREKKAQKKGDKDTDEGTGSVKRGRYEEGRGKQGGRGRGSGSHNGGQPAYCNSMYTGQTNPFYRSERGYDPRQGQISWGQYHVQGHYYQYPQQGYSSQYTQYSNASSSQYNNTPSTQYSHNASLHAMAGAGWHSQYQSQQNPYQELSSNIARLQQPPPPPPPAPTSQPPPPPPSATFGLVPPPPPPGTD